MSEDNCVKPTALEKKLIAAIKARGVEYDGFEKCVFYVADDTNNVDDVLFEAARLISESVDRVGRIEITVREDVHGRDEYKFTEYSSHV